MVTLDTSHLEMSQLNIDASEKIPAMSVIVDTFHSPIGPCVSSEQSPFGDSCRHAPTAVLSTAFDAAKNTGVGAKKQWTVSCMAGSTGIHLERLNKRDVNMYEVESDMRCMVRVKE